MLNNNPLSALALKLAAQSRYCNSHYSTSFHTNLGHMSHPQVFFNDQAGACPIFVQNDIQPQPRIVEQVKNDIQRHGGIVLDDPEAAIVIVIIDQTTIFGSQLRAKYGGDTGNAVTTGKAVVAQAWVGDSIQQGRILGPPEWGGHGIRRHNVQTYFGKSVPCKPSQDNLNQAPGSGSCSLMDVSQLSPPVNTTSNSSIVSNALQSISLQDQDDIDMKPPHSPIMVPNDRTDENFALLPAPLNTPPVDNSILEGNYRPELEVRQTAVAEQPGVEGGTSTGSNPEGVNKPVDSVHNRPSTPGTSHSLGTAPTVNQIATEELDTLGYSSSGGNTCQSDVRFQETSPETQGVYDSDITSITGLKPKPPPRHNVLQGRGHKFTETDRNYLVELFGWWVLNPLAFSTAGIYAQAAIDMPWHSKGSIRGHTRNNPELFGNPAKSKQPSKRSQKSSSEYRQNQEVPDDWSYKSDDPDNEESDDLGSPENSGSEEDPDFDDLNDGSSFHDFPSDSEDSDNSRSIDGPDDQDTIPSNYHGMDSSEDQPHIKDKGKGPGIRPSSDVFQAMVVKLSENLDAFFEKSNRQRKMKLWEAFAKSHPHHSANSYYGWHRKYHEELELAAIEHLSAAQSTRHGKSNRDGGRSLELATPKDRLPSSKAPASLTSRSFGTESDAAIGTAPTTSKRAMRDNQSSTRPAKKARFSQPESP